MIGVKDFLQDLNPTLLTTIESEFDRVADEAPPTPTRASADVSVPSATSGSKSKVDDPLEDLFPRVDIDKIVSSAIVTGCNDANWKARKEALEQLQGILEANKRFKPNIGTPVALG